MSRSNPTHSNPPDLKKRMVAFAFVTSAVVFSTELLLRLMSFDYAPTDIPIHVGEGGAVEEIVTTREALHVSHPRQLWVPKPSALIRAGSDERINALGFRGPEVGAPEPQRLRIVVMGESTAFGMRVGYEESFCGLLESGLERRGVRVEVICMAVVGHTIEQGLERYLDSVRALRPDLVIAAYGCVNEHIPGFGLSDAEKIAIFKERDNWLWRSVRFLRHQSRVAQLLSYLVDESLGSREAIAKAIEERKEHHSKLAASAGTLYWTGKRRVSLSRFSELIRRLHDEVIGDGAELILVSLPRGPEWERKKPILLEYTHVLEDRARELGIPLLDARGAIAQAAAKESHDEGLFVTDRIHPSPEGHRVIAREGLSLVLSLIHAPSRRETSAK